MVNKTYASVCLVSLSLLAVFVTLITKLNQYSFPKFKTKSPKHVLFIVADDLGWSDLGFGAENVYTPFIDHLASQAIMLNYSYTYSMCTPSRNSILSGVYAERTGLQHFVLSNTNPSPIGLPLSFNLMPQYFNRFGYKSHMVGKWHLGSCSLKYTPAHRGFDSFFGFFYGEGNYYTHRVSYGSNESGLDYWDQTRRALKPVLNKNNTYSTFSYVERAIEIINNHNRRQPLFLYYAAQNPHSDENFNVPEEYARRYNYVTNRNRRNILGMVTLLDESILNITRALKKRKMLDDTIIVFTSDNGGEIRDFQRNFPLRGGKTTVFEGGHRVRGFIHAKDLKPYTYNGMFHSVDWIPTILSGALGRSIEIDKIDGVNQWDVITKNLTSKRDTFIYNIDPFGARNGRDRCDLSTESIRYENWKLIVGCPGLLTDWYDLNNFSNPDISSRDRGIKLSISEVDASCLNPLNETNFLNYFLFNIKDDPLEKNNLAAQLPCLVRDLQYKLDEFRQITVEPLVKEPLDKYRDPKANPKNWGDKWMPGWC